MPPLTSVAEGLIMAILPAVSIAVPELVFRYSSGILGIHLSWRNRWRFGSLTRLGIRKSGILTEGHPVTIGYVHQSRVRSEAEVLGAVLGLEARAEGPVAASLRAFIEARDIQPEIVSNLAYSPGEGLSGTCGGKSVAAGSRQFITGSYGIDQTHLLRVIGDYPYASRVYVGIDGKLAGLFYLDDPPAGGASTSINNLILDGITPVIVTGDNEQASQKLAGSLEIKEIAHSLDGSQKDNWTAGKGSRSAMLIRSGSNLVIKFDGKPASDSLGQNLDEVVRLLTVSKSYRRLLLLNVTILLCASVGLYLFPGTTYGMFGAALTLTVLMPGVLLVISRHTTTLWKANKFRSSFDEIIELPLRTCLTDAERGNLVQLLAGSKGVGKVEIRNESAFVYYDRLATNRRRIAETARAAGFTDIDRGYDVPGVYSGPPVKKRG